jgi:sulfoxide reductase catalytic subunit YedY
MGSWCPCRTAPLRPVLPWKYGFNRSSRRPFSFIEKRPVSFWETVQGSEYSFWANVNPEVPHPRWSQVSERVLERAAADLKWNGWASLSPTSTTG